MTTRTEQPNQSLALVEPAQYAVMQFDAVSLQEIVIDNLGGSELTARDLPAITIPLGGATTWVIPTLDGEVESDTLDGIIVHHRMARAYWLDAYTGDSTPPICTSDDGLMGVGQPGGPCRACPFAQFAADGARPACRARIDVFLLRPDSLLPYVLRLPPTSFKAFQGYTKKLTFSGVSAKMAVTRFTLRREKKDKLTFAVVEPRLQTRLAGARAEAVRGYIDAVTPLLRAPVTVTLPPSAYDDDDLPVE